MSERLRVLLVVLLAAAVRFPFWSEALRTPLDGDAAILGLMARHLGHGTTFWGQPYGSPVEAWLVAPFVFALGTTTAAVRLPAFLLSLALVPLAYGLARALDPRAAMPSALLMACPSPYLLLLAAMPPPLYPTTLLLCGVLLLLAVHAGVQPGARVRPKRELALCGLLAGLAVWTHLMSLGVVAAALVYLVRRSRGRRGWLVAIALPLLAGSSPVWLQIMRDPGAARAVGFSRGEPTLPQHAARVVGALHRPIGGLLGTHVPLVADDPQLVVRSPAGVAAGLTLIYGALLVLAARRSGPVGPAGLLLASAALTLLGFPLSLRAGPEAVRFLTPAYLPVLALVAWSAVTFLGTRPTYAVVALLAGLHLAGSTRLLGAWRAADRAAAPFFLPDLAPARRALEARGITHAYASYGPAYRLTYESGEAIVASQFRNERFPGHPLPYLDEIRFAKNVAWVLTPGIPSDMPWPRAFENDLETAGGVWQRAEAGAAVIYHGFVPPFSPAVVPLASAGRAGDADLGTLSLETSPSPTVFALPAPMSLDAVTLAAGYGEPALPRSLDVEVSPDGAIFETVARRRRSRERLDLVWLGGHPEYAEELEMLAIPLHRGTVAAIRITPTGASGPWGMGEILLHPAGADHAGWDEWLDPRLSWAERKRALEAVPLRGREDWYYRSLLAARHAGRAPS